MMKTHLKCTDKNKKYDNKKLSIYKSVFKI